MQDAAEAVSELSAGEAVIEKVGGRVEDEKDFFDTGRDEKPRRRNELCSMKLKRKLQRQKAEFWEVFFYFYLSADCTVSLELEFINVEHDPGQMTEEECDGYARKDCHQALFTVHVVMPKAEKEKGSKSSSTIHPWFSEK